MCLVEHSRKSGCVRLPPDIFHLILMGLNVTVCVRSCHLKAHQVQGFGQIVSRGTLLQVCNQRIFSTS